MVIEINEYEYGKGRTDKKLKNDLQLIMEEKKWYNFFYSSIFFLWDFSLFYHRNENWKKQLLHGNIENINLILNIKFI